MKGAQCYELFGGIALKNYALFFIEFLYICCSERLCHHHHVLLTSALYSGVIMAAYRYYLFFVTKIIFFIAFTGIILMSVIPSSGATCNVAKTDITRLSL